MRLKITRWHSPFLTMNFNTILQNLVRLLKWRNCFPSTQSETTRQKHVSFNQMELEMLTNPQVNSTYLKNQLII